jgi:toxin-antitoxin system PIN domain toxin
MAAALLDVNFLIALFDADHVHHDAAHDWLAEEGSSGWATCPVTENGFVRVVANPRYGARYSQTSVLIDALRKFCANGPHEFWPDAVSLRDENLFALAAARGYRHLTDVYLLGLAVKHGGRLVTFDQSIPIGAVKKARRENLVVLAPA